MALIKCPECKNSISDQAEVCPKCGYELTTKKTATNSSNNFISKINFKYVAIILILIIGAFFLFKYSENETNTGTGSGTGTGGTTPTTPSTTNTGYSSYSDPYLGISFEIPDGYKVTTDKEGFIYVGKNIDNQGALIPYVIIGRYDNFTNEVQFLNSFTDYMKKQCSDLKIIIDLVSGVIGNKTVYGLAYSYSSSNHLIIDNRYAVVINNKVYMIGSKEENTNTAEINSVVEHIISTLTERGA